MLERLRSLCHNSLTSFHTTPFRPVIAFSIPLGKVMMWALTAFRISSCSSSISREDTFKMSALPRGKKAARLIIKENLFCTSAFSTVHLATHLLHCRCLASDRVSHTHSRVRTCRNLPTACRQTTPEVRLKSVLTRVCGQASDPSGLCCGSVHGVEVCFTRRRCRQSLRGAPMFDNACFC